MSEIPLPGMPEPSPKRQAAASGPVHFSRYRTKTRRLCDMCVVRIHYLGVTQAPYPRVARWRVSTESHVEYLCEQHKEEYGK